MEVLEKRLEMRGMQRSELEKYFISIDGENIGSGKFTGQDWEVEISEEKLVVLGSIEIPARTVIFRCREEILEKMIFAFRLRFLSAGG